MDNKSVFAENLQYYMDLNKKKRKQVSDDLGFSYFTFCDWVNGKKYPRMDKVEILADYFHIKKSDLIENKHNVVSSSTINSIIQQLTEDEIKELETYALFLINKRK